MAATHSQIHAHVWMNLPVSPAENKKSGSMDKTLRFGISERLLILTVVFVMLAEVLIFVPSIANFRNTWLQNKLAAAHSATLVLQAAPEGSVSDLAIEDLMKSLGAQALAIKMQGRRQLIGVMDTPPMTDIRYDLRETNALQSIAESFDLLLFGGERTIDVIGPAPLGGEFVELVLPDKPLRDAMIRYSINILLLSLLISGVTAALVYFTLFRSIVQPVKRLSRSITAFASNPDDASRIIRPSGRFDELGIAEESLADMQRSLLQTLKQRERLAQLGLAVSKINHDLRNMLSSAQLFSDRLTSLPDPTVQRFAPKLISTLDRAISFCQATLAFGKAEEKAPDKKKIQLHAVIEDVQGLVEGLEGADINWSNEVEPEAHVLADIDQLTRMLTNLARNSIQAMAKAGTSEPTITIRWSEDEDVSTILVCDNGPGLPAKVKEHLFEAFQGTSNAGSTGLGLAITADLAHMHGGTIDLVPVDQGTCFRIQLPQA
jgi:signal transduction histidine kinase